MFRTPLCLVALAAATLLHAQVNCPSRTLTERWMQRNGIHADIALETAQLEQQATDRDGARTIPVVVHVVWRTQQQNVSNAVINNIITELNEDYNALNSDYGNVRAPFTASRGNAQIEFCLATLDPSGNPTTGINRYQTTKTWFDPDTETDDMKFAPHGTPAWNPMKYLNIWICNISSGTTGGFVTAGYAYLPQGGVVGTGYDGLVLDYMYGTTDRTATHEIGHYLGLDHPWGAGNCSPGDGISDTPPTNSPTYSCSNPNLMKCGTLTQYENFMDYSSCPVMFTNGQATVMNNILSGVRSSLLTSTACSGGITGPCIPTSANGPSDGDYIGGVVLGSINNASNGFSAGMSYVNYTAMSTVLQRGSNYALVITGGAYSPDHYAAWIDYNGDNNFTPNEKLGEFTTTAAGQTQTINFTVPGTASLGNKRLRIRGVYHGNGEPSPTDPCFAYAYGETEDYTVNIVSPGSTPICIPISAVGTADGDFINGVVLGSISNTGSGATDGPYYHDYTGSYSTTLLRGGSYTLQVTNGDYYEDFVAAWIDFDGNGQFTAAEKLGETLTSTPGQTVSFPFTVPNNALAGNTVLRVRVYYPDDNEPEAADPCFSYTWGETEDYRIVISTGAGIASTEADGIALRQWTGMLALEWPSGMDVDRLLLMDASGRVLEQHVPNGRQFQMATDAMAQGLYLITLHTSKGVAMRRIAVSR